MPESRVVLLPQGCYTVGAGGQAAPLKEFPMLVAPENRVLVPASNFRVGKLESARVQLDQHRYILRDGWGLWDVAARAWVGGLETIGGVTVVVPWAFARRGLALIAKSQGLYQGYGLWLPRPWSREG